jgi:meso-butanediol dehydrogenase/(S,S)-butanediol dehydrogenase/diacetyl reductase
MTDPREGRLAGRRALITGASRGIGRAIAEAYAREGADLFLTATSASNLADTEAAIANHGGKVVCHGAEISDEVQVEGLFNAAVDALGQVDLVVNNAGVYLGKPFTDYTTDEFDQVMKVNVYGVFHMMQRALRHMQGNASDGKRGKIVNIASTAGKWESPNQAAYNASKHAVVALTRCAALENAGVGINVNAICPGFVDTDMIGEFKAHADRAGMDFDDFKAATLARVPIGRALDPAEIAHIAVYLGSSESDGMTGQTITISGGLRMG